NCNKNNNKKIIRFTLILPSIILIVHFKSSMRFGYLRQNNHSINQSIIRFVQIAYVVKKRRQILHLHGPNVVKQQILIVLPYLRQIFVHTLGIELKLGQQGGRYVHMSLPIGQPRAQVLIASQNLIVNVHEHLLIHLEMVALRLELIEQNLEKITQIFIENFARTFGRHQLKVGA
ncbi:hypothetical protein BpHYR1_032231, partial [Brachionus plicatilis]